MPTLNELQQLQALPLEVKIRKTEQRIHEWVDRFGIDGVYVSFSGGKDSTVLLDICRRLYPDIKAMFVDVPTQYPELKEFASAYENIDIVKPQISFAEVCEKYGFPMISKEVSRRVHDAKIYLEEGGKLDQVNEILENNEKSDYKKILVKKAENGDFGELNAMTKQLFGVYKHKNAQEYSRMYDRSKYLFMLQADFNVSDSCCYIMKKTPAHRYGKETGRKAIVATMAEESMMRAVHWLKDGCNAFDSKIPTSKPMSFWTEQDVLLYIKTHKLPICSVYGDIVVDDYVRNDDQLEGQLSFCDLEECFGMEIFESGKQILKTTGCNRTGCMLCGFGCHIEKTPNRFELLKETHPKFHNLLYVLKNNGVTYAEAIDWINEHGNLNIKY